MGAVPVVLKNPMRVGLIGLLLFLAPAARAFAQKAAPAKPETVAEAFVRPAGPGFDEKLGARVPLDLAFTDEYGNRVLFREAVKGPTLLSIVYYKCPNACDFLLYGIAAALRSLADRPGDEPNLVTVTIDPTETPADARAMKKIALASIEKPFPDGRWRFLTGSEASIASLTDAVGFRYVRNGSDYDHPLGIIVLSGDGMVVRYEPGTEFLPAELKIALMEASSGIVSPTVAKLVQLCFSYDPKNKRLAFNTLGVSATVIIALLAGFVLYLVLSSRRRLARGDHSALQGRSARAGRNAQGVQHARKK